MIQKIGLAVLLTAMLSAPVVLAADGMANEWEGFHVGGNALYGMGSSDLNTDVSSSGDYFTRFGSEAELIPAVNSMGQEHAKAGDIAAGIDAGYDWQFSHFVFGLDGELTNLALSESSQGFRWVDGGHEVLADYQSLHTDWSAALRPHVGLALGDFLLEANAGVSLVHANYSETFYDDWYAYAEGVSVSRYMLAPELGLSAHYHVTQNWVAKLDFSFAKYEQQKLDHDQIAYLDTSPPITTGQGSLWHTFDLTVETLNLGLDYQF